MHLSILITIIFFFVTACGGGGEGKIMQAPVLNESTPNITILESVDGTAPLITLTGDSEITIAFGREYLELGATAVDDFDGEIFVDSPSGVINVEVSGQYVLMYSATDAAGNASNLTRTIIIAEPRPFITTWSTDRNSNGVEDPGSNQITIPTNPEFANYNYNVNWGDGTISESLTGDHTHTYASPGIYTVEINGDFPQIYFGSNSSGYDNDTKLLTIEQWGDIRWLSMKSAFAQCYFNVKANDAPNLQSVADMSSVFAQSTFNDDISDWDVSSVTDMSGMFQEATSFNQDIGHWDVSSVTDMSGMFAGTDSFVQDIGTWDVSSVTNMSYMFSCRPPGTFASWPIYFCTPFNGDIGAWDVSSVTDMSGMFQEATSFNQDIGHWDVNAVTDMSWMFAGTDSFIQDIGAWDVSSVTNMSYMFGCRPSDTFAGYRIYVCTPFNSDIGAWDVSSVTNMRRMFSGLFGLGYGSRFNQDIGGWDVSSVTNMSEMFSQSESFNQELGSWDVTAVTDMSYMFHNVTLSTPNYDALLMGWAAQDLSKNNNFFFSAGSSEYSASAAAARNILSNNYGWTISDGGLAH